MKKRILFVLLALAMMVAFIAACRPDAPVQDPPAATQPAATQPAATDDNGDEPDTTEPAGDWIIGIVTGTVTQGEEEFMAGQKMRDRHGADRILTVTYPDRFNDEMETTIAQVMSLADQGAQAIVFCQAVPGTIASIQRVRERFPDILFVAGTIMEPPTELALAADVILQIDDIGRGTTIMETAHRMGAETFIHYSFPRHLGIDMIAQRRAGLIAAAERLGINFVEVMAPDPTGDAGPAGAQQFIVEDVPRQVAAHGVNTVFFSTNCIMQEPLIRGVLEQGAMYAEPCCPSPYHAFPAAMNISTAGNEGNVPFMMEQISLAVAEAGMTGRVANWPVPVNMLIIEAGVDYAIAYLEGRTNGRVDPAAIQESLNRVALEYGVDAVYTRNMVVPIIEIEEDEDGEEIEVVVGERTLDNMFLIISGSYIF
ncbi:MAG: DUF3798 domain-containing protein [Oscillospiraceae bacterium]|nr:DUF3798 domain-containing protein [Oscillospiraceae bacterium]